MSNEAKTPDAAVPAKRPWRISMETAQRQYAKALQDVLKWRFIDHLTYTQIEAICRKRYPHVPTLHDEFGIRKTCKEFNPLMENPEEVAAFKRMEPNLLDGARMLMVKGMVEQLTDPKRRQSLDLSRLTYGYGILYDKQRLERGESTANVRTLSDLVREAHARPVGRGKGEQPEEAEVVGEGNEG